MTTSAKIDGPRIGLHLGPARSSAAVAGPHGTRHTSAATAAALLDGRLVVGDGASPGRPGAVRHDLVACLADARSVPLWDTWFRPAHLVDALVGHLLAAIGAADGPVVLVHDGGAEADRLRRTLHGTGRGQVHLAPLLEAVAWCGGGRPPEPGRLVLVFDLDRDRATVGLLEARTVGFVEVARSADRRPERLGEIAQRLVLDAGRDADEVYDVRAGGSGSTRRDLADLVRGCPGGPPTVLGEAAAAIGATLWCAALAGPGDDLLARLGRLESACLRTGDRVTAAEAAGLRWELFETCRMRLPPARPDLLGRARGLLDRHLRSV